MVFKLVSGSSENIQEIWQTSEGHSQALAEIMNVGSSSKRYYKSRRIKRWTSVNPREVHIYTLLRIKMVKYVEKIS